MSACMAISFDDGSYIPLPPGSYPDYEHVDYGSEVARDLHLVDEMAVRLGLRPLSDFVMDADAVGRIEELEEEIWALEDEGEDAAELRRKLQALRPSHAPSDVLRTVRGLLRELAEAPDDNLELAVAELKAYEIVLQVAQEAGRNVYIDPY